MSQPAAQAREVLAKANEKRLARSALRKQLKSGEVSMADLIREANDLLVNTSGTSRPLSLFDVLQWQADWGPPRTRRFVYRHGLSLTISVDELSPVTRERLAEDLA